MTEKPSYIETINNLRQQLTEKEVAMNEVSMFIAEKTPICNCVFRLRHKDESYRWIRSKTVLKWRRDTPKSNFTYF